MNGLAGAMLLGLGLATHSLAADLVRGAALQGDLMVFKAPPGAAIILDGAPQNLSDEGYFAVGFHRDDSAAVRLEITTADGQTDQHILTPQARSYDIQRIDNLPTNMVTPPQKTLNRIRQDIADVKPRGQYFRARKMRW